MREDVERCVSRPERAYQRRGEWWRRGNWRFFVVLVLSLWINGERAYGFRLRCNVEGYYSILLLRISLTQELMLMVYVHVFLLFHS